MTSAPHDPYDCVIIGGGPAGLTAAVYLARYRRRIVLFDGGESRAALMDLRIRNRVYPDVAFSVPA